MPAFFYVGVPRSGKSYLMMKQVIVPAIAEGRNVVTNFDGINQEAIHKYLSEVKKIPLDRLGKVVTVTDKDWLSGHCFPSSNPVVGVDTLIHGGDLVCIDEAQMFWGFGDKLSHLHLEFLTQHGHYVDPVSKRCCDVALATQDLRLINRKALGVIDKSYKVERKDELGMNGTYIVSTYSGSSLTRGNYISTTMPEKYDPLYFTFYHSFSGGEGVVAAVDSNSNILKSKKLRYFIIFIILLGAFSVYGLMSVFKPKVEPPKPVSVISSNRAVASLPSQPVASSSPPESPWQVVGHYRYGNEFRVFLRRGDSYRTLINPRQFYVDPLRAYGVLDGLVVANYTGLAAKENSLFGAKK